MMKIVPNMKDVPIMDASSIHHYYYSIFRFPVAAHYVPALCSAEEEIVVAEGIPFLTLKNDTCISDSLRSNILC